MVPLTKVVIQDCRCGLAAQLQVQRPHDPHDPPLQRSSSSNWKSGGQSSVRDLRPIGDFRTLFFASTMCHQSINPLGLCFSTSFLPGPFYPVLFLPFSAYSAASGLPLFAPHHLHFFWVNHPTPCASARHMNCSGGAIAASGSPLPPPFAIWHPKPPSRVPHSQSLSLGRS